MYTSYTQDFPFLGIYLRETLARVNEIFARWKTTAFFEIKKESWEQPMFTWTCCANAQMWKIHVVDYPPAVGMDLHLSAAIKNPRSKKGVEDANKQTKTPHIHTIRYYFYKSQKQAKLSNMLFKDRFVLGRTVFLKHGKSSSSSLWRSSSQKEGQVAPKQGSGSTLGLVYKYSFYCRYNVRRHDIVFKVLDH